MYMFFVSSFFVCYWQVSPTHNRPAGSGEQKQSYTVLSSPPRVAFGLRYGTISSCWHTTASQPGGHSVNKMSVARETEKAHYQPSLQLSGRFLLELFKVSIQSLFFFSLPSKVKFSCTVWLCTFPWKAGLSYMFITIQSEWYLASNEL